MKLIDQIIPANGLVFTKDARQHGATEPGQIGFAPQVVMGVNNGYVHGVKNWHGDEKEVGGLGDLLADLHVVFLRDPVVCRLWVHTR